MDVYTPEQVLAHMGSSGGLGEYTCARLVDALKLQKEVVGHLTSPLDTPEPMHPDVLIANHFELDGGTPTGMSPEVFEEELRKGVLFWKNRVQAFTEAAVETRKSS